MVNIFLFMKTFVSRPLCFLPALLLSVSCIHQSSMPVSPLPAPASMHEDYTETIIHEQVNVAYLPEKREWEEEVNAIAKAYAPGVSEITHDNGEWVITLYGKNFFFREGRLLPEGKNTEPEKYRSYGFYRYPLTLPEITPPDPERVERMKRYNDSRTNLQRDNTFLEALYGGENLKEILTRIKKIDFLGFGIEVHEKIVPHLKEIDREIRAKMDEEPELKQFLRELETISAFNWRHIEGSMSRSYHSFGIAVDFIPYNLRGRQIYWNWTRVYNDEWYSVPYEKRWMVPVQIVEIFEKYGFVWGGKWMYYDNMHFEYRPELLILSGMKVEVP